MGWINLFILSICLTSAFCDHEEGHAHDGESQEDGGPSRGRSPVGPAGQYNNQGQNEGSHGGNSPKLDIKHVYDSCKSGICLAEPEGCVNKEKCQYMAVVEKDKGSENYNFTLARLTDTSDVYVAVGLSKNGKNMEKASIVACFHSSSTRDNRAVYWSENSQNIVELFDQMYIFNERVKYADGKLICTFQRKPNSTVHNNEVFDLNRKNEYKLLMAIGKTQYTEGNLELEYHKQQRRLSDKKYDFTQKSFSYRNSESLLLTVTAFTVLILYNM